MQFIMRTDTFAKLFFLVSITGLVMYAVLAFYTFHTAYTTMFKEDKDQDQIKDLYIRNGYKYDRDLKYILLWTDPDLPLVTKFDNGQQQFINRGCPHTNCFITTIKEYLGGEYTNFDAIIFDINVLTNWRKMILPEKRKTRQKYIFYSVIPSDLAPICTVQADDYFNWTWSYKLYSDIVAPFIEVKNLKGDVVAPYPDVSWDPGMVTASYNDTNVIRNKTKAVAWVINKCVTKTPRRFFARELQKALLEYSLVMDIYGCRNLKCPKEGCLKAIEKDYYFYLAYEDSIEDDYVTDEVLKGYHHNAVPIVIGGADYTQFLPYGSYINARFLTAEKLSAYINYAIKNPEVYMSFYRWKKYYTIEKTERGHGICDLCNLLNDHERMTTHSSYTNFRNWWYTGPLAEKCYPKGATNRKEWLSYINNTKKHKMYNKQVSPDVIEDLFQ